ncbi:diiron oxygenase [Acidithiobacillus sp. IBUN Pt1247-S3]|uniref:diiron oxygenase n=1 Tax=Acidithiobacillus sp. IBUN Pt1247-S3 TaxID=3166642 RepID=UPI0034E57099
MAVVKRHHDVLIQRLSRHSASYRDPLEEIPWDTLDPERAWLPDSLVSLYGLPEYEALSAEERIRLSQVEFVSFCELGLWLEALFIQRLGSHSLQHLYGDTHSYHYQLHELREEVGHSLMFLELQHRAQLPFMTPPKQRPRLATWFARLAPEGSAAFWATILIGENVPDQMNRSILVEKSLPAAVLGITQLHRREEARHMAFARITVQRRSRRLNGMQRRLLSPLLREVMRQFLYTTFFPVPAVYAAAGLESVQRLARLARQNPQRIQLMNSCAEPSREFLRSQGFFI